MGNRAVLQLNETMGMYVHWNGGLDTIKPFLDIAKEYGLKAGDAEDLKELFQLAFSQGEIGKLNFLDCDNDDNGVYVLDEDLNIVGRKYTRYPEQSEHNYKEMLEHIRTATVSYAEKKAVPLTEAVTDSGATIGMYDLTAI